MMFHFEHLEQTSTTALASCVFDQEVLISCAALLEMMSVSKIIHPDGRLRFVLTVCKKPVHTGNTYSMCCSLQFI